MANGISGSTVIVSASGYPAEDLMAIELRVLSNLFQLQMGSLNQDDLRVLRNDQAFELGLALPVPGN
jgi:hypothetical protein